MRSLASVQLQLLDFLYIVHSKKGTPSPCADPVRYIKKIKNTDKRTIYYAIKILITIFCYSKGNVGKKEHRVEHGTLCYLGGAQIE